MKNNNVVKTFLLIFSLLLFVNGACEEDSEAVSGADYKGRVVGVSDGDTFTLLTPDKQQIKVRLSEIDAPESAQPYGTKAKQALSDLIFSKDVQVVKDDMDRYGRLVGHIYVNGDHVNRKLVQEGMAWAYRQYLQDQTLLQDEQQAREAKRGLWSLPGTEQVPPWEWRQGNRNGNSGNDSGGIEEMFACGTKTKCSQMSSCEEVMYYLKECGITTLDGDGDGVPCEALCK